jgi:hypothetical protein
MPLTTKGESILQSMEREYGSKKGEGVFYASRNAGTISGVDAACARVADAVRSDEFKTVTGVNRVRLLKGTKSEEGRWAVASPKGQSQFDKEIDARRFYVEMVKEYENADSAADKVADACARVDAAVRHDTDGMSYWVSYENEATGDKGRIWVANATSEQAAFTEVQNSLGRKSTKIRVTKVELAKTRNG